MKKTILTTVAALSVLCTFAQWKPVGDKIKTPWAEKVDPANVLPEYPRPQMVRSQWVNLNGLWDYAIKPVGAMEPKTMDGKILVPFAVESSLSGVQKGLTEKDELWYRRTFSVPAAWKGSNVLLNFGAVDWKADVFVNDILAGSHTGGFTPFSLDITPYLKAKGGQKLVVRVFDGTDKGYQPRGKQVLNPNGIWYTPVSGIWQTVWIEPVAKSHISGIKAIPNLDQKNIAVTVAAENCTTGDLVEVKILDKGKLVASATGLPGSPLRLCIAEPKLWSPDSPFLYDMEVSLRQGGKTVDKVDSYTAMRKIGTKRDKGGILRMTLNDKPLFHFGPLDQGWWPDGLFTAPTDEALLFDILKTKELGYNMIRKHVKVEPARWYYHCDREGILVWQDMPSGDMGNKWEMLHLQRRYGQEPHAGVEGQLQQGVEGDHEFMHVFPERRGMGSLQRGMGPVRHRAHRELDHGVRSLASGQPRQRRQPPSLRPHARPAQLPGSRHETLRPAARERAGRIRRHRAAHGGTPLVEQAQLGLRAVQNPGGGDGRV